MCSGTSTIIGWSHAVDGPSWETRFYFALAKRRFEECTYRQHHGYALSCAWSPNVYRGEIVAVVLVPLAIHRILVEWYSEEFYSPTRYSHNSLQLLRSRNKICIRSCPLLT